MLYFIALTLVTVLFNQRSLSLDLLLFGVVSVSAFFIQAPKLLRKNLSTKPSRFIKNVFLTALLIRLVYVIFIYVYNNLSYGTFYESNPGDIHYYISTAQQISFKILNGNESIFQLVKAYLEVMSFSDFGYVFYLSLIYAFTNEVSLVILPLLLKSVYGAFVCVFVYKIASRHFNQEVAKLASVLTIFQFNLIWWCGSMMKETEMLCAFMFFLERADALINNKQINFKTIALVLILACVLFSFRTILGFVALFSLFAAFIFNQSVSKTNKIVSLTTIALLVLVFSGPKLVKEFNSLTQMATSQSYQQTNMKWRSTRADGNQFAKYAGAAVFAPLILTIPFPSMVYTFQGQEMQMQAHGGYFEKNILSFLVMFAFFYFLKNKSWKPHILLISALCLYLIALVFSVFAQSGRFHVIIIPLEIIFASYGITLLNKKNIKWFNLALCLEFAFCLGWAWFKLAGRGLI